MKGFSLVELAIGLMLLGLFVGTSIEIYNQYLHIKAVEDTRARAGTISIALQKYYQTLRADGSQIKSFPCPAIPTDSLGVSFGSFTGDPPDDLADNCWSYVEAYIAPNDCTPTGFCRLSNSSGREFFVGAIPYSNLGISEKEALDGWGRKLTYIVSRDMTVAAGFDISDANDDGALILAVPEDGDADGNYAEDFNEFKFDPVEDRRFFMVLSHGKDGKGAFTAAGKSFEDCGTMPVNGKDSWNCDFEQNALDGNGGIFLAEKDSFLETSAGNLSNIRSRVRGVNFYDDYILLSDLSLNRDFWSPALSVVSNPLFPGASVGIGWNEAWNPDGSRLSVRGNIMAWGTKAGNYCGEMGEACFRSSTIEGEPISGGGVRCPNNANIGGIQFDGPYQDACEGDSSVGFSLQNCTTTSDTLLTDCTAADSCDSGKLAYAITAAGYIKCKAAP